MPLEWVSSGHTLTPIGRQGSTRVSRRRGVPITVAKAMAKTWLIVAQAPMARPTPSAGRPRPERFRMASLEQNKAVVRRFMTEVLQGGNLDLIDEILAPDYVNTTMGNVDRTAFKAMLVGLKSAGMTFSIKELVAEGDSVVVRFTVTISQAGEKKSAQGLTYYRIVNGQILVDEPLSSPDLAGLLAPQLAQMAHA
jgi:predicted SnoaL-like aldol condensation-catalyzing enzyme